MPREAQKAKIDSARRSNTVANATEPAPAWRSGLPAWRRIAGLCAVLIVVTLGLYWPVLGHPFINYDDDDYVTANAHVRSGVNEHSLTWALTATEQSNWHPLTWISHELDCQFYGLNPAGHHFTNLAFHVVNVVLLFLILCFATQGAGRSFLVALLFAIHPLNVESVAWIAERKNVLSTAFFLLAIAAYGWYVLKPEIKRYALVLLAFLLGLASKPMVITLPCVLLLLDYWPLGRVSGRPQSQSFPVPQRSWRRLFLEKVPLFLLSAGSAVLTIFTQKSGGALKSLADLPVGVRVENAICAYAEYFLKTLWPSALAPHYPHPGITIAAWQIVLSSLFLVSVSALVWRKSSSRPYLLVGWCWFLGTLVPVIGLIQVGSQAIADRYMYVPIIGLLVLLVWGACDLLKDKVGQSVQVGIAVVIVAALLFVTYRQIGFWRSSVDLWSHTVDVTQDNYVAEDDLGMALADAGRSDEALVHFHNAGRIAPADASSHLNIAVILQGRGDVRQALVEYSTVIKMAAANPTDAANARLLAVALANLGTLYNVNGLYAKARENYRRALQLNPTALDDLIIKFKKFAAAQPEGKKYLWLGEMLEQAGRNDEAREAYAQGFQLDPTLTEAQVALGRLEHTTNGPK